MPIYDLNDIRVQADSDTSSLSIKNTSEQDYNYAMANISDFIKYSGFPVHVYRVLNTDYDRVWGELRGSVYSNPVEIDGFYKPSEVQIELKKWGVDAQAPLVITFSIGDVTTKLPEAKIESGDVIKIQYTGTKYPEHYRINSVTPTCMYRYRWFYYKCYASVLPADYKVRTSNDMDTSPLLNNPGKFYEG